MLTISFHGRIGSFRKEDSNVSENVTPKYNLALSQVFRDYSVLFSLYNASDLSCYWTGMNGSKIKIQNAGSLLYAHVIVKT